jgi:HAD superfamily hydrolase (TIGR01509 family)
VTVAVSPASARIEQLRSLLLRGRALIFDVDGTLAETEELHRQAFNEAFARAGMDWHWGRTVYKDLLRVAGGKERIRAFDQGRKSARPLLDGDIADLHRIKTGCFADLLAKQGCPLRPGVHALISVAMARGQRLAIATTTSRENIDALLSAALGRNWSDIFDDVVAGDEVPRKKPAPDVYLEALSRLRLSGSDCLAIEDSANGLIAALHAEIPVLITRSLYFQDDDFTEALLVLDDLTELPEIYSA